MWIAPNPTLRHFALFVESGGLRALVNTLIIAGSATLLALLFGSLAAYGLARYEAGGDNLPFFVLSQRFMPPVVIAFPFLMVFKVLQWMDTHQALIVIYLTFKLPYAVWMMRSFFLEIPREIEESALVDGCSPFSAFWRIALPLVAPGLVATGGVLLHFRLGRVLLCRLPDEEYCCAGVSVLGQLLWKASSDVGPDRVYIRHSYAAPFHSNLGCATLFGAWFDSGCSEVSSETPA